MPRRRPTVLTVMGILNIVFGCIFLLCNLCNGLSIALFMGGGAQAFQLQQNGQNPFAEIIETYQFMQTNVPGFVARAVIEAVLGLILSVLLLIAGIGLLKVKNWGRVLSILYSIVAILLTLADLVFKLALMNPALERFNQGRAGADSTAMLNVISVVEALLGMAYAVVLLIMMLLPSVSLAIAGRARSEEEDNLDRTEEDERLDRDHGPREEWQ